MFRFCLIVVSALMAFPTLAAELTIDFSKFAVGSTPTGFVSTVTGTGRPGDWKIVEDQVPSAFAPLTTSATVPTRRVLAQLDQDSLDEHFPLLIYDAETFGDFTLTTRFKCVRGATEQMAGIAFRIQDEKNYYVVRASSTGNNVRFYKFVNGERSTPIGPEIEIPNKTWHELTVSCKASQIRVSLNGKDVIPTLTDSSFANGKIGFWTKSDSVSQFADTKITFTTRIPFAQELVTSMMTKYPRLIALKIYAYSGAVPTLTTIASTVKDERGQPGDPTGEAVIRDGKVYYGKSDNTCSVVLPLPDRNGEIVAALRVVMKPFPGQTENNAVARAIPIKKDMQNRIQSVKDLLQ